jgi:hypothetical protein
LRNPGGRGAPKRATLLPCGIVDPRHASDCMSGFPD